MRFYKKYTGTHQYQYLPDFAKLLLENHLDEFVNEQYKNSLEADLPLLKQLSHIPEEELRALSRVSQTEYLQYLSENKATELIELTLGRWKNNDLGIIGKLEIMAEDINLINFIRNQTFRHFIPLFTKDLGIALKLINEIDSFLTGSTIASSNFYIQLMKERLQMQEMNLLEAQQLSHIGSFEQNFLTGQVHNSPELHRIFNIPEGTKMDEFMKHVHPDDVEKVNEAIKKAMSTGSYECEYRYLRDGVPISIWSKGVVTFEDKLPVKFFGTIQDITERKATEQLIIENATALERSNESLQQFAYVASHDLKEPLRKVSMLTDRVLSVEKNLSKDSFEKLEKIQRSSERMLQMIDDIMAYSTLQQWEDKQLTDLNQVVAESLEMLEQSIEEKNANIKINELPQATIVPAQFRQLFQNLIGNAIKFSKDNVPPQIIITHQWLKNASMNGYELPPASQYLQVNVRDNGIGFKKEFAKKIFLLFSRLNNKSDYEGSGLGLAISKKIVENHHGIIFADSNVDEGTVFSFIIPQ